MTYKPETVDALLGVLITDTAMLYAMARTCFHHIEHGEMPDQDIIDSWQDEWLETTMRTAEDVIRIQQGLKNISLGEEE